MIIPKNRNEIPQYLTALGLMGKGVEVGVKQGEYSKIILDNWNCSEFYLVDAWRNFENYVDIANVSAQEHLQYMLETLNLLKTYDNKIITIRALSKQASTLFPDETLDFVYLDANHTYEGVLEDLIYWFPKVKKGGVLAGHDYVDGNYQVGVFGVKTAVNTFFKEKINICTLPDWYTDYPRGPVPSWWVNK